MTQLCNPHYGLTDEFRYQVLKEAETETVLKVARRHNLHFTTIYNWRKRLKEQT